ncbi:MAG: hypothetical protein AB7Q00_14470 [Phycisphaerales bacterium]
MALDFNPVNHFVGNVGSGAIDLDTHTFKAVLSNTAPDAQDNQLSDITQIANGGGYATGGVTITGITWTEVGAPSGEWRFDSDEFEWTGSGGGFGPFQYVYLYSDTSTGDLGVGWYDFGSPISIPADGIFRVVPGANGHIEFQPAA